MGDSGTAESSAPTAVRPWEVILTWGIILGLTAVVLIALGPHLMGDVLGDQTGGIFVPTAVLALYSVAGSVLPPFSAALVGAALVMRHAESLAVTRSADGARAVQDGSPST